MKAILEFNLPEDEHAHRLAINSARMATEIIEAGAQIRNWVKYGHEFKSPDEALNACQGLISSALEMAE